MAKAILEHRGIDHEDARRSIRTLFNGDLGDFVGRQVKVLSMKRTGMLGGHYHNDYTEVWYVQSGRAVFELDDQDGTERYKFDMGETDRIVIPPMVAHRVLAYEGCILIGITEKVYVNCELNDQPFNFGPWQD